MKKYIWVVEQIGYGFIFDTFNLDKGHKFVVSAENEEKARSIAAEHSGAEGADYWKDPKKSSCKKIGIAFDLEMDLISES